MNSDRYFFELYKRVGKNIAFFRKKNNLNQKQLADELNLGDQSLISQYENAKKSLSLERIKEFADFFEESLEDFIFYDYTQDNVYQTLTDDVQDYPIHKLSNKTYFGYYIREQNAGQSNFAIQVASLELKILTPKTANSADIRIYIEDKNLVGSIIIDDDYAHIFAHNRGTSFFINMVFYYYKHTSSQYYRGGMSLITKRDYHHLPTSQYCILSLNAISKKHNNDLEQLLKINQKTDCNNRLSNRSFSSSGVLRLTKKKDSEVFYWLNKHN